MPQTILTGSTLAAGIRSDFQNTWREQYDGVVAGLKDVMDIDVPQSHLTETFGYRESLPIPTRWQRGNPIPTGGLGSKSFSVTAYDFARRIKWHRNDRMDNKVGDLAGDAKQLAGRFARLDSIAFAEILANSASMLPAIPNAPDGNPLFYSGTRFGNSGGNVVSGDGVTTVAQIQTNWFEVLERFDRFADTAGEPIFEPNMGTSRYVIYAGSHLRKLMNEALVAEVTHSVVSTTGAGVTNAVLASGEKVEIRFTSRIASTQNDWYVFRPDAMVKPIFSTLREALRTADATEDNSDESRSTGLEYFQAVIRKGYSLNMPYGAIQVDNS